MEEQEEFTEITEDYIIVVRWHTYLGGHWTGYIGSTTGKEIPEDLFHRGATGEIIKNGILLTGFDTLHSGDVNIGPNGEAGHKKFSGGDLPTIWDKNTVFDHLYHVAECVLNTQQ